ncbi:MAG: sulfatase-like hydrolase/transferase [Candidatus Heimdallarchaeaceae archaeon]
MKKKIAILATLFLLSLVNTPLIEHGNAILVDQTTKKIEQSTPQFEHVVFITWDGVRPLWMQTMTENGTLTNAQSVLENGGYWQPVRITNHEPGTDPGLSTMETGYGPNIHGIFYNQFGPGSPKDSIPDGLTTAERLKAALHEQIKIGYFLPWSFHQINEEYMNQQGNYTDSIFEHIKPGREVDYWFASENLSWTPWDNESKEAAYHGYKESYQLYLDPLIKASYLAERAAEFIANYSSSKFYIRMHFTEPDNVGHAYFESDKNGNITPEYFEALVQCDQATGIVLDALSEAGILDNTLIIIGTDHGFYKENHQGAPWPANRDDVVQPMYVISDESVRSPQKGAIDQMDLSPTILSVLGVDLSTVTPAYVGDIDTGLPMWERIDQEAPKIRAIKYQTNTTNYVDFINGSIIINSFNLSVSYTEWTNVSNATIVIGEKSYQASRIMNKQSIWSNIDLTDFKAGNYTIEVTLQDTYGYTTKFALEIQLEITAKPSSFNLIWALLGVSFVSMQILWFKKRR